MLNDVFSMDDLENLQGKIKGVKIDECGVWNKERETNHPFQKFGCCALGNIQQAISEIPKLFEVKARKGMGSYSGKHDLERWRDKNVKGAEHNYISNGAFIIAMMHCGYTPKLIKMMRKNHYNLNVWFSNAHLREQ